MLNMPSLLTADFVLVVFPTAGSATRKVSEPRGPARDIAAGAMLVVLMRICRFADQERRRKRELPVVVQKRRRRRLYKLQDHAQLRCRCQFRQRG